MRVFKSSDFTIHAHKGQGAYGTVYEATITTEEDYGRRVALKRITLKVGRLGISKSIFREIGLLDSLDHPNILKILGFYVSWDVSKFKSDGEASITLVYPFVQYDLGYILKERRNRLHSRQKQKESLFVTYANLILDSYIKNHFTESRNNDNMHLCRPSAALTTPGGILDSCTAVDVILQSPRWECCAPAVRVRVHQAQSISVNLREMIYAELEKRYESNVSVGDFAFCPENNACELNSHQPFSEDLCLTYTDMRMIMQRVREGVRVRGDGKGRLLLGKGCLQSKEKLDYRETEIKSKVISALFEPAFDESHIRKIARELLLALRTLHDRSITHRDLKPANILISEQSETILADFGLARRLPSYNPLHAVLSSNSQQKCVSSVADSLLGTTIVNLSHAPPLFEEKNINVPQAGEVTPDEILSREAHLEQYTASAFSLNPLVSHEFLMQKNGCSTDFGATVALQDNIVDLSSKNSVTSQTEEREIAARRLKILRLVTCELIRQSVDAQMAPVGLSQTEDRLWTQSSLNHHRKRHPKHHEQLFLSNEKEKLKKKVPSPSSPPRSPSSSSSCSSTSVEDFEKEALRWEQEKQVELNLLALDEIRVTEFQSNTFLNEWVLGDSSLRRVIQEKDILKLSEEEKSILASFIVSFKFERLKMSSAAAASSVAYKDDGKNENNFSVSQDEDEETVGGEVISDASHGKKGDVEMCSIKISRSSVTSPLQCGAVLESKGEEKKRKRTFPLNITARQVEVEKSSQSFLCLHSTLHPLSLLPSPANSLPLAAPSSTFVSTLQQRHPVSVIDDSTHWAAPLSSRVVTSWYRPPELFYLSKSTGGSAVDVWGVGCILSELLRGSPLFSDRYEDTLVLDGILRTLGRPSLSTFQRLSGGSSQSELSEFACLLHEMHFSSDEGFVDRNSKMYGDCGGFIRLMSALTPRPDFPLPDEQGVEYFECLDDLLSQLKSKPPSSPCSIASDPLLFPNQATIQFRPFSSGLKTKLAQKTKRIFCDTSPPLLNLVGGPQLISNRIASRIAVDKEAKLIADGCCVRASVEKLKHNHAVFASAISNRAFGLRVEKALQFGLFDHCPPSTAALADFFSDAQEIIKKAITSSTYQRNSEFNDDSADKNPFTSQDLSAIAAAYQPSENIKHERVGIMAKKPPAAAGSRELNAPIAPDLVKLMETCRSAIQRCENFVEKYEKLSKPSRKTSGNESVNPSTEVGCHAVQVLSHLLRTKNAAVHVLEWSGWTQRILQGQGIPPVFEKEDNSKVDKLNENNLLVDSVMQILAAFYQLTLLNVDQERRLLSASQLKHLLLLATPYPLLTRQQRRDAIFGNVSVSPEFADFILDLLQLNPERRLTADAALKHPWFTEESRETPVIRNGEICFEVSCSEPASSVTDESGTSGGVEAPFNQTGMIITSTEEEKKFVLDDSSALVNSSSFSSLPIEQNMQDDGTNIHDSVDKIETERNLEHSNTMSSEGNNNETPQKQLEVNITYKNEKSGIVPASVCHDALLPPPEQPSLLNPLSSPALCPSLPGTGDQRTNGERITFQKEFERQKMIEKTDATTLIDANDEQFDNINVSNNNAKGNSTISNNTNKSTNDHSHRDSNHRGDNNPSHQPQRQYQQHNGNNDLQNNRYHTSAQAFRHRNYNNNSNNYSYSGGNRDRKEIDEDNPYFENGVSCFEKNHTASFSYLNHEDRNNSSTNTNNRNHHQSNNNNRSHIYDNYNDNHNYHRNNLHRRPHQPNHRRDSSSRSHVDDQKTDHLYRDTNHNPSSAPFRNQYRVDHNSNFNNPHNNHPHEKGYRPHISTQPSSETFPTPENTKQQNSHSGFSNHNERNWRVERK